MNTPREQFPSPEFRPDRNVENDLRWYFRLGQRPKGLTDRQRQRWRRIDRDLNGFGHRLSRYYGTALHDPRLGVYASDDEIREVLHCAGVYEVPPTPLEWVRQSDALAARGADNRDEREILDVLRANAPTALLTAELARYENNAARHYSAPREKYVLLTSQAAQRAIAAGRSPQIELTNNGLFLRRSGGPQAAWDRDAGFRVEHVSEVLGAMLRGSPDYPAPGEIQHGPWGLLRIGEYDARSFAGRWYPWENLAGRSDVECLDLIEAYSKIAMSKEPRVAAVPDGAPWWLDADAKDPLARQARQAARDARKKHKVDPNFATISELADLYIARGQSDLVWRNKHARMCNNVRRALTANGCPVDPKKKRAQIPTAWLRSEAGLRALHEVRSACTHVGDLNV